MAPRGRLLLRSGLCAALTLGEERLALQTQEMNEKFSSLSYLLPAFQWLRKYHQHEVVGLENIPKDGSGIIITNHSFASYDTFLLGTAIFELTGRIVRSLGDNLIFKIPYLNEAMSGMGMVAANMTTARELLDEGDLIGLTPGGMREALRSSKEKYRIRWDDRKGFVRLALTAQCPIILAACPAADDIFDVSTNWMTQFAYQNFKIPVAFVRGRAGVPFPRPVKLIHHVGKPLPPPKPPRNSEDRDQLVDQWHGEIVERMNELMKAATPG